MSKYQIAVIIGSIRSESFNAKLADGLIKLAPADFSFKKLAINNLPLYNQDLDNDRPESVILFKKDIETANGVLFVTPEYNRSIPGVLKNAIDQASRPYGKNSFQGKPAGILGISVGTIGTALAQQHLRNILAYLNMPTLGQPEVFLQAKDDFFTADGNIGVGSKQFLQNWMDAFVSWVKHNS